MKKVLSQSLKYLFVTAIICLASCSDPEDPDTTLPNVSVEGITENEIIQNTKSFTIQATDNDNINKIDVFIDNTLLTTLTTSPYEVSWNTITVAEGQHTVKVAAVDKSGNEGKESILITVNNNSNNAFTYEGKSQSIKNGYFYNDGPTYIKSTGAPSGMATMDTYITTGVIDDSGSKWTGNGDLIYISFNSGDLNKLAPGSYRLDTTDDIPAFTYSAGAIAQNFNLGTDDFISKAVLVISGTVKVSKSESQYTIDFDLMLTGNKPLKGNFTGALTELE